MNPFDHNPDINPAWRPLVAQRVYKCEACGNIREEQTNHTGRIYIRCRGKCRTILNANTAQERVLPAVKRYLYVEEKTEGPFKCGDVVQVEGKDGLHPVKYTVEAYAGHGFWKVRPQKKGAFAVELPQSRLVFA